MEKFIITKDVMRQVKRFNLTGRTLEFKIKPFPRDEDAVSWTKDAINQIIEKATEGILPGDQVGFTFCSKYFKAGDGWLRFQPAENITYTQIWEIITGIFQSNSAGLNTDTFCLGVTVVRVPKGKGRARRYNNFDEESHMRGGIIKIINKGNLCLPLALVTSLAHVNKDPQLYKVRRNIRGLQVIRALKLVEEAGVVIPEEGAGVPELEKFQRELTSYKIVVYTYGNKGRDVMFEGVNEGRKLNLLYYEGHYNVITSLTSAFCAKYYCEECHIPYDHKNNHRCSTMCPCCQQVPACPRAPNIKCSDCKRAFRGARCIDNHRKPNSLGRGSVCEQIHLCVNCLKTVKSEREHVCGEVFCKICNSYMPQDHLCYILPDKGAPKLEGTLFIFFDFETMQEKVLENGSKIHEPNLCVFSQCCYLCIDNNDKICGICGVKKQVLKINPVNNFTEYVFNQRKLFRKVICLAHNAQAFDNQFILKYILTQTALKPDLIMKGTKIISMTVENVKFIDSLNYFPMPLSKLPAAFDLNPELKKGYFPHLFNKEVNKNYTGVLPAVEYYDPDNMKVDAREKFLEWYEEHKCDNFDMVRDLEMYCTADVEILRKACLKFRQQLIETSNVCPFSEACTIASATGKVFRRNFLKPNTIGIVPKNGYRWRDNQSKIAIQWLVWEERQRNINIIHAAKQEEVVIHGVKVDGYCEQTKQVFEFHGCYYHGCLRCFNHNRDVPLSDNPAETLNTRLESTINKTVRLRELGYDIIEMWGCQFRSMLKENEDIKNYTEGHPYVVQTPLNPRDSFYGGRTGNTFKYYKAKDGEKISYVDVCSLYPYVCKYGKFPKGHPDVFVGKQCDMLDLEKTDGVISCKILPPRDLYHPVLPIKMNDKLMFVLCRTCGKQMNQGECQHNDEERSLTATWIIDEVLKSVQKGYKIIEVYEVWKYEVQQYDKTTGVSGMFTEMMDRFIKIKQEASGWPSNCVTLEQKNQYIEDFLNNEGVQLEFDNIVNNPGLRALAKLILNSFWGKMGQRENQPKTRIVRDSKELFNMYADPGIYVNTMVPIGDETLVVNYEHADEVYQPLPTVSVVIAAYVTAQARLKLYSYLEKLGERVLYYDTDSVIYVSKPGDFAIPTGKFIGDMTDELSTYGTGSFITEFVSGGPKNYAYKVYSTRDNSEKVVCKVKGISLTYEASLSINFDSIKNMILNDSPPVYIVSNNIRRTTEYDVVTKTETKIYKPVSTKRKFLANHSSVPYGYKKFKI